MDIGTVIKNIEMKLWLNRSWNDDKILLEQMDKQILCGKVMLKCQRN